MKFLAPALACLALVACGPDNNPDVAASAEFTPDVRAGNIEAHIRFLASDYLQGRDVGTDGYEIAANYVAAQMQLLGLEPAGDNGSYFQQVPLQDVTSDVAYAQFSIDGGPAQAAALSVNPNVLESEVSAPLVFVGYGVSAANRGHDDYADIDATGKIVVLLEGVPDGLPSEERAHHISGTTKRDVAAAHGAVGIIILNHMSDDEIQGFADRSAARPVTRLTPAAGASSYDTVTVTADVGDTVADQLFAGAPMSLAEVEAAMTAEDGASFPHFDLPHTVTMRQRTLSQPFTAPNVAGLLRGSDPDLATEVVALSAHLDHIGSVHENMRARGGCRAGSDGDTICNGALDNAAGIAVMLETARAFQAQGAPRRSVMFVAMTAEEKGLLGSEYYARNPTVPLENIVANVDLDMPVLTYVFTDIIAFGADHSTLGPIAARAAARFGMELTPDPMPEQSIFVRSDHYNFVRQGVPALFLMTGHSAEQVEWADDGFMGYLRTHYHRASDELDGDMTVLFDQGARFADLNYLVAREIADSDERPAWNEGDFFGDLYSHHAE